MLNTLSGRFLMLTIVFVMLAEVLIFVPSIARFREDYLLGHLERAQIAALATLAGEGMVDDALEVELLKNAGVYNIVLRRDESSQLVLSSPVPGEVHAFFDIHDPTPSELIGAAVLRLTDRENRIIRVFGEPVKGAGLSIEVTMESAGLRAAMIDYGLRILMLSAVISVITAMLLFLAVQRLLVMPIKRVVGAMQSYAEAPEDARRIIAPSSQVAELKEAEESLQSLEQQLTNALRQKERLAQLGGAVAKISHDLRNILTTAQLFADRMESSADPTVKRVAPKMVRSLSRAVALCENTLAFGKAEEPAPTLSHVHLGAIVGDVVESERLAAGDNDVSFAEDVPAGLVLRADGEQLFRVLSNLIRNARQAIEASAKHGEIGVRAEEDDFQWIVHVTDTGPGLPPKAREHLFRPFKGGTRQGGTGLGLAISAELIRGHGGKLELLSSDDGGTAFRITLPKAVDPVFET